STFEESRIEFKCSSLTAFLSRMNSIPIQGNRNPILDEQSFSNRLRYIQARYKLINSNCVEIKVQKLYSSKLKAQFTTLLELNLLDLSGPTEGIKRAGRTWIGAKEISKKKENFESKAQFTPLLELNLLDLSRPTEGIKREGRTRIGAKGILKKKENFESK
ncbi:hypothetical protein ACLOJK_006860, partial [Asimina triloba]